MKFTLIASAIVACSAVRVERSLAQDAQEEKTSWADFRTASMAVGPATRDYLNKKATSRKEESQLLSNIQEVTAQEVVVKGANEDEVTKRNDLFTATLASHKALEGYMNAMLADSLSYKK